MLALQKQNYHDNEALDGIIDFDMSTTWVLSWLTLPQRNVICFEAPLHSTAADRAYVVCVAWDRLGRRDNHDDRFASPVYMPCITACTLYPLPSPCPAVDEMTDPADSSGSYHVDGAAYWSYRIGCHRRKKYRPIPILPNICKYRPIPNNPIPVSFEPYCLWSTLKIRFHKYWLGCSAS